MNKIVAIVGALAALNGFAAEKNEPSFKTLDEARIAFNRQEGEVFCGTAAVDYRALPGAERLDTAAGAGKWVIALPIRKDACVRFIAADDSSKGFFDWVDAAKTDWKAFFESIPHDGTDAEHKAFYTERYFEETK